MGIERARVTEVHAADSATGRVGSGYQVSDRLVLTSGRVVGRHGPTAVRPGGTAVWVTASVVWRDPTGEAAIVDVDDPSVLVWSPGAVRWGRITGGRAVAVTAIGFASSHVRPERARDTEQFLGHMNAGRPAGLATHVGVASGGTGAPAGDGLSGAALFAGPNLVGVLLADPDHDGAARLRAISVAELAADAAFAALVGGPDGLALSSVSMAWSGLPILQLP